MPIADCLDGVLADFERLLENEGFQTTIAWTGQYALQAVQSQAFDRLLVNDYLPDMNTEDFISELQRRGGAALVHRGAN